MKTISVRDVRQRWPEAERSLAVEGEIVITRDGKPVARLLPMEAEADNRPRFDPEENRKWRRKIWGDHSGIDTLALLQADREERNLS
jgi:antitoxin (DNA-binding transcriptional repressor) of toxin-antitoxin stability system